MKQAKYKSKYVHVSVICNGNLINFPNGWKKNENDFYEVYVFDSKNEFYQYQNENYIEFYKELEILSFCDFNKAKILDGSCYTLEEAKDKKVLFELTGIYTIYSTKCKNYFIKNE